MSPELLTLCLSIAVVLCAACLFLMGWAVATVTMRKEYDHHERRLDHLESMGAEMMVRLDKLEEEPEDHSEDWRKGIVEEDEDSD